MIRVAPLVLSTLLGVPTAPDEAHPEAWAAVLRFFDAWAKVETLTFTMHKSERLVDGRVAKEVVRVKMRRPAEFYLGNLQPKPGQEVIYSRKRNPNDLVAHPGSFPDLTVNLSISGSLATKDQHHLITSTGYSTLADSLRAGFERPREERRGGRLEYGGSETFLGRTVDKVIIDSGDLPHRQITAPADESVLAFGRRIGLDPYLVVYFNGDKLGALSDSVSEGETYVAPWHYGKRIELMLDKETGLSLRTTIYDWDGRVYEQYEHRDLVVNPKLTDLDFDPENPAYHF